MLGRIMVTLNIHVLTSGNFKVRYLAKETLQMIKDLEMITLPLLSGWTQYKHKGLCKGKRKVEES